MTPHPSVVTIHAHAKINLTLDVGHRRSDGYHDIHSVMQTIALHDTLEIRHTPHEPGVRLIVTGDEADGVPADASNIVHQAAVRLQKIAAARGTIAGNASGLHVTLTKRIPSQAGLGGGSSDAAAALWAIDGLLDLQLAHHRLAEIGAALGTDVPFFLTGGAALAEGLGEKVTPLSALFPPLWLVLVKPPVGMSTALAYAALDAVPDRKPGKATETWLRSPGEISLGNDFEPVVLAALPQAAAAHAAMLHWTTQANGSFRPLLCGSGSAVFGLVRSEEEALELAGQARQAGIGKVWVTRTWGAEA